MDDASTKAQDTIPPQVRSVLDGLKAEQRRRAEEGTFLPVEDYLQANPLVAGHSAAVVELIVHDCQLRIKHDTSRESARHDHASQLLEWARDWGPGDQETVTHAVDSEQKGGEQRAGDGMETVDEPAARPADDAGTPRISGYEILSELGRGGMGVVFQARHHALGRLVALKMVLGASYASREEVARFTTEAEMIARLQHPNIVQVFEIGAAEGRPFFSLEYVNGGSLAQRLDGGPIDSKEAAALLEKLARAVAYAHQQGIIHRDLKPANILLQIPAAEVSNAEVDAADPADAVRLSAALPKITDFGLAKLTDDHSGSTRSGVFLGTPSYCAPEQAEGSSRGLGPHTDVYALGAILYQLLTGRPPFRGITVWETLDLVRNQDPVAPRLLNPKVNRDLETICLKCLRKEPADRYASAVDLAEDLRRMLAGEPISARRIGPLRRLGKWVLRHPALASLFVVSFIAVLASVGLAVSNAYQQTLRETNEKLGEQKKEAETQKAIAQSREAEAVRLRGVAEQLSAENKRLLYAADMSLASQTWADDNMLRLRTLLERHIPTAPADADLRNFEWHYLNRLINTDLFTLTDSREPVMSVAFNVTGKYVALAGYDGRITLWGSTTGKRLSRTRNGKMQNYTLKGHRETVLRVAFSQDDTLIASASIDGTVKLWEVNSGRELFTLHPKGERPEAICFSPDSRYLACASWNPDYTGFVQLWNLTSRQQVHLWNPKISITSSLAYHPGGQTLAVGGLSGKIRVYNTQSGDEVTSFQAHPNNCRDLAFNGTGSKLASAGADRTVKIWQPDGKLVHTLKGHGNQVTSVDFSPDGKRLASAGLDTTIHIWDPDSGTKIRTFKGHLSDILDVAFASDNRRLASAGWEGSAKIWDTSVDSESILLERHTHHVFGADFTPDNAYAITAGADRKILFWEIETGKLRGAFEEIGDGGIRSVAINAAGTTLLTGSEDQTARLWKVPSSLGQKLQEVARFKHAGQVHSAVWHPDQKGIITGDRTGKVTLWSISSKKPLRTFQTKGDGVNAVAVSADGKHVAAGTDGDKILVWDCDSGRLLHRLDGGYTLALRFRPGSTHQLVSAGLSAHLHFWNTDTGEETRLIEAHTTPIYSLAFTADGKRVASGGWDIIRVWDSDNGQETLTLRGHTDWVYSLAFSPDGKRLVSGAFDNRARLWSGK